MNRPSMIFVVILSLSGLCFPQEPVKEQKAEEPPKLEIPEITIVGKKAITLPFARKGEIYDVTMYDAPSLDSSLLGIPPSMSLLTGTLPRYQHREQPWRVSAEGLFGSFGTGKLRGYVDYKGNVWGVTADAGYASTRGHVTNAASSQFESGAAIHSIVHTDNPILKSFRTGAGVRYTHDSYGMFGVTGASVNRTNNAFNIQAGLGTLNRQSSHLDIDFTTQFTSMTDSYPGGDSAVSVVSPRLSAAYTAPVKNVILSTSVSYAGSSLVYQQPSQSPSVADVAVAASWKTKDRWEFEVGGMFAGGSDSKGTDRTLIMPTAMAGLPFDSTSRISFWFQPKMRLTLYDEHLRMIPYLSREVKLQPERRPISFGTALEMRSEKFSFSLKGTFDHYSNKEIIIAGGGDIRLEYPEASIAALTMEGSLSQLRHVRLSFAGSFTSAHEAGGTSQLPMIPVFDVSARGEMDLAVPVKPWISFGFQTSRNVDRGGSQSLPSLFLLNCGVSSAIVHRLVLGAEIKNLLNIQYEWWKDYPAPGIEFRLTAKVNIE